MSSIYGWDNLVKKSDSKWCSTHIKDNINEGKQRMEKVSKNFKSLFSTKGKTTSMMSYFLWKKSQL